MQARLRNIWEQSITNFWVVPMVMVLLSALLAFGMVALDREIDNANYGLEWIYSGGPEGARSLLSSVASSVISVAGTIFSITIAALTLASSQFGPRLLRNFVRDIGNQLVLGTFISTFIYCLLVVRTVRSPEDIAFVPHLSVTVGVLLAIASIGVLIYFINHIAHSIQADAIIRSVGNELEDSIHTLFPEQIGANEQGERSHVGELPDGFAAASRKLKNHASGYLQVIDSDQIIGIANKHDLLIKLPIRPGQFVSPGSTLALVWPKERATDEVMDAVKGACFIGDGRTSAQDVEFSVATGGNRRARPVAGHQRPVHRQHLPEPSWRGAVPGGRS